MSKFKKTNKVSMDDIFVIKGNQVVPTGNFVTSTTAFNIQDGQLGVLAWDFDSTVRPLGEYKRAGDDSNEVQAIKLVVGTPKSQSSHTVSLFEDGDLAYQESGVINKTNIRSVSVKLPEYGTYGAQVFEFSFSPEDNTEYKAYLRLKSVRNDRFYGDNDEVVHSIVPAFDTADVTGTDMSYVLENLAYNFNLQSKETFLGTNNGTKKGNRNFVVFGVNQGGGTGLEIGTITVGTAIPFITVNGITSSVVATAELVQTLATLVNASGSSLTNTSTIEVIEVAPNANVTSIDTLIVVGLPHSTAAAYDEVEQVMVMPELNLAGGFRNVTSDIFKGNDCNAKEDTGHGSKWLIEWRHRAGLKVHTAQLQPRGDWFIEGKNYINPDAFYTSYILEYFDTEDTLTTTEVSPKKVTLLFAATATTTDTVADLSDVYEFTTTGTTTVTYVNNILDAWLEHARTTGNPFSLKGDIAGGGVYLA